MSSKEVYAPIRRSQKTKGAVYAGLFFVEVIIPMLFDGFAAQSGRGSKVANAWQTASRIFFVGGSHFHVENEHVARVYCVEKTNHVVGGKKTLHAFATGTRRGPL